MTIATPSVEAFWAAAEQRTLVYGRCRDCTAISFYPRPHCTTCLGRSVELAVSDGIGSVYSLTTVRVSGDRVMRARVPYVVALVDVDEGFRMMTHLVGDGAPYRIGERVEVCWDTIDDGPLRPFFRRPGGEAR